MKIDGITLLQMIKDNKLKDNTRIDVSYLDAPIYYVIAKLNYKDNELNWEPGTFRVSMLYDDYYTFEIIEDKIKKIGEIDFMTAGTQKEKNKIMKDAINEAIKVLNYLLEKSDENK